jgi:hypothetical protein
VSRSDEATKGKIQRLTVLSATAEQVDDVDMTANEFHDFHFLQEVGEVSLRGVS